METVKVQKRLITDIVWLDSSFQSYGDAYEDE